MSIISENNTCSKKDFLKENYKYYIGLDCDTFMDKLLSDAPKRRKVKAKAIECREDREEDFRNTYLGQVKMKSEKGKALFDVFVVEHYYFSPKLIFKKVGKGGIGFIPRSDKWCKYSAKVISLENMLNKKDIL